jgi:sugar phosphate isomerase/epimerase
MNIVPAVILGGPIEKREPDDFCALVKSAGIQAVEVCTGKRGASDAESLDAFMASWDDATAAHGLKICALNCSLQPDLRDDIRAIFRAAADRGIERVKVDVSPSNSREPYERLLSVARENWGALAPIAREYGVKALAEVHPKIVCHSPSAMRRMLDGIPPDSVGAILDPGNMTYEGWEDMHESVDILGPYLAHLHVKNGAWERSPGATPPWRPIATALDDGIVDWFETCRELHRAGFVGYGVLEFLRDEMNNREWIAKDVRHFKEAVDAAYGVSA